jgi:hypothetical protein
MPRTRGAGSPADGPARRAPGWRAKWGVGAPRARDEHVEEGRLGEEPGGDGVLAVSCDGGRDCYDEEGEEPRRKLETKPVEDLVWGRDERNL